LPVPTAEFIAGMRRLAGGVTIVTSRLGEIRAGLTATSVCSLTAEPPRLVACIHRDADAHGLIFESRLFAVNLLTPAHHDLSEHFGGRDGSHGPARFTSGRWRAGHTGMPVLSDAAAVFECRLVEAVRASTHSIFIGEVEAASFAEAAPALVYHDRGYHRLRPLDEY
jgi:flavin reductase (DIM6/NTAB) family NADH-FMN oxidoreductase RutF